VGGRGGQTSERGWYITYDNLATFDVRQADFAIEYIKKHAKDDKPFFMDVNFMKMHNPTNAAPKFAGKSRLGDYSIHSWSLMTTSAGSWTPFAPKHQYDLIVRPTTVPGRTPIRRRHHALPRRKRLGFEGVGVCRA